MRIACRAACVAALLMAAQPWPATAQDAPAPPAAPGPSGDQPAGIPLPAPAAEAPAATNDSAALPRPAAAGEGSAQAGASAMPDSATDAAPDVPAAAAETNGTVVPSASGAALSSPVLTINEGALYAGSAWGRRVQADLERLSRELAAENDRIYDELAAQEDELTALRATLPPDEFRKRADAFDAHAQAVRAERQAVVRNLNDMADAERQNFFAVSVPIFADVMGERGAMVILDQRMVFISADAVDVTETLIERIDAEIGAGPAAPAGEAPRAPNLGKPPATAPETAPETGEAGDAPAPAPQPATP